MSRIPEEVSSKLTRIATVDLAVYWRWVAAVIKNRLATILAVALVVFWLGVAFHLFTLWVSVFGPPWFDDTRYEELRRFAFPYGVIETILEERENWRLSA